MAGVIAVITRILKELPLLVTAVISLVQVAIKLVKELVTAVINIAFPFFPDNGKFELFVMKVRDGINKFDAWFEAWKNKILVYVGVVSK